MSQIPDHILKRLQKLLKLAKGAKEVGSLAEAENAATRANEILLEYNLSTDDVDLEDKPKVGQSKVNDWENKEQERINFMPKNEGKWLIELYFCICKHNLCRGLSNGRYNFTILGEPQNIEMVKYIAEQLKHKLRHLARDGWKKYQEQGGWDKKNAYIRGFLLGAVEGIDSKLYDQRWEMEQKNNKITDLIHIKGNAVKEYEEANFKNIGSFKSGKSRAWDGQADGYEAGQKVEINKGLGSNAVNQKLLG